jgi:hypothetical protein
VQMLFMLQSLLQSRMTSRDYVVVNPLLSVTIYYSVRYEGFYQTIPLGVVKRCTVLFLPVSVILISEEDVQAVKQ